MSSLFFPIPLALFCIFILFETKNKNIFVSTTMQIKTIVLNNTTILKQKVYKK